LIHDDTVDASIMPMDARSMQRAIELPKE
jgi:hypothetical protein